MTNKSWFDLTDEEKKELSKLTPDEQVAVDAFIAAARALPKTLCIGLEPDADVDENHLTISKRITANSCRQVAGLHKKSLCF